MGLGPAGVSQARRLAEHGYEVVVTEERPSDASRARAGELVPLGVRVLESPIGYDDLLPGVDLLVPSPAVPIAHPAVQGARARGIPVVGEFELAAQWSDVPMVAVTGTNGKTTTVALLDAMLRGSGLRSLEAGNNDLPLVDAIVQEADVLVVEASSFRLELTGGAFRPHVAVWLNLAPDHLDWHPSMEHYAAAKAKIWANHRADDLAIVNAEDPVVMAHAASAPGRVETFGLSAGDWRVEGDSLVVPDGSELLRVEELWRSLPHDCTNALAASAAALGMGAELEAVRSALRSFRGLPHRIELVGDDGEVRFYDDSKATDPPATVAALRAFESSVLIAGGRNKDLDLSVLADEADRVRAVVAIGEAAGEVAAAFDGVRPVREATSMDDAVSLARSLARPGDAVLLSPACASYDWYRNYAERGDDFARAVREQLGAA